MEEKVRITPAKLKSVVEDFHLEILNKGLDYETREIRISDVNRPALQLVGFYDNFDVMRLQIKVNDDGVIEDAKFKTYGCGSAIASSSLVTEWVKGKTLDEALQIKNADIADELALPPVKIHCSILAEDAIKAAVSDYQARQEKKKAKVG